MSTIIRPSWPLGTKFISSKKRKFQVVKVVMGNPENKLGYEMELQRGWMIVSEAGEHPQTSVGFVDLTKPGEIIVERVEDMDQFVKNGHLKITGYDFSI